MLYRRSDALIAHWNHEGLIVRNYARGTCAGPLTPHAIEILNTLGYWQDEADLRRACPMMAEAALSATLTMLVGAGVVQRSGTPRNVVEEGLAGWEAWGPSAAFFHLDTKDVQYVDRATNAARADRRLLVDPPLPRDEGEVCITLPPFSKTGAFPDVLLTRRSWRRFGRRALSIDEVSTVMGLTWATQRWMELRRGSCWPLKTSPSGGAAHSLEVYVLLRNVRGVPPGLYRYACDAHGLIRSGDLWPPDRITASLGGQAWASSAAAIFYMTSVFPRVQWKYKFGRAYRAVLLEAGHFCQTFCLVSTWLKLAPFCTAALADTQIERDLGVDGVTESVIYAMGIGPRPGGVRWAPWPDEAPLPATTPPAHQRRRPPRRNSRSGRSPSRD